jgi:hypothetical protein
MTWNELLIWALIIGLLIIVVWLMVASVRRLGAWLMGGRGRQHPPARRAAGNRPAPPPAPTRVELAPARQVEVNRHVSQPTQSRVQLGPARRVQVDTQALFGGTPVRRGAPLVIPKPHAPLWAEKGWQRNGHGYAGTYRAGGRPWRGLIEEPYPGGYKAFIWDPPLRELERRTSHRPCFRLNGGGGRYEVHFHRMPASLDHAITNVETVLAEALGARL